MKALMSVMALLGLLSLTYSCSDRSDIQREEIKEDGIQREEAMRSDDIRETDSFDNSVPLETDEEVEAIEEE